MPRAATRSILVTISLLIAVIGCSGGSASPPPTESTTATSPRPAPETSASQTTTTTAPDAIGPSAIGENPWTDLPELPASNPEAWTPATRTEELTVTLSEGVASLQDAIDAFDVTFAELPGATVSDLPAGDGLMPGYVVELITSVRDRLTAEQVAIVDDVLEPVTEPVSFDATGRRISASTDGAPVTGATTTAQPAGFRAMQTTIPDQAVQDRFIGLLGEVIVDWHTARPDLPMSVVDLVFGTSTRAAYAVTTSPNLPDTSICRITVLPPLYGVNQSDNWIRSVLAHELFHCVEKNWNPYLVGIPLWVLEGAADYAAGDLYRAKFSPESAAINWFSSSSAPLAARSYDAWALFETLREMGHDPYATIKTLVAAGPQGATLATLALAPELMPLPFRLRWVAQSMRSTEFTGDPTWALDWLGPVTGEGPRDNQRGEGLYGVGSFTVNGVGDFGHHAQRLDFHDEVGLVAVIPVGSPIVTHTATGTVTVAEQRVAKFCFDDSKCVCPEGTSSGAYEMTSDRLVIAFPAIETAPHLRAKAVEWDPKKHCERKPKAAASSNGDPHLVSFDGLPFDVMALGEFVASRDPAPTAPGTGFEVQTRHAPFESGFAGTTAVAVTDGTTRITLTAERFERDTPVIVRVDGVVDGTISTAGTAGDGISMTSEPNAWTFTWPDGSTMRVEWATGFFLTFDVEVDRAARLVGLLGSANGNLLDDLQLPDGTVVDALPSTIDETFAAAWAVSPASSLFDYEPDESPATFRLATAARFAPQSDADALARCRDSLGEAAASYELTACAADVVATGDEAFVEQYADVAAARSDDDVTTAVFPEVRSRRPSSSSATASFSIDGVLYDGIGDPGRVDAVPSFDGELQVAAGSVVVVRANACPPGLTGLIDVELTPLALGSEASIGSGTSILCDGMGLKSATGGDAVVAAETYLWVPVGGTYAVSITVTEGGPFPMRVGVFTDSSPTVLGVEESMAGYDGTLGGIADTVVLQIDSETATTLALDGFDGFDDACVVDAYGAPTPGDDGPWDLSVCKHLAELAIGPTFGTPLVVVLFNRTEGSPPVTVARR